MASDTQKNIEFALKLTGADPKVLNPLLDGFKNLEKAVSSVENAFKKLPKALENLKVPKNLTTFANALGKLGDIKLKDLGPLATNLTKISKIEKLPPIGTFVNNVVKLSGTSFAGLSTLAKNLQAFAKINVETIVSKIRELNTALSALEKRGGLTSFARFATDIRTMRTALDSSQASINSMTDSMNRMANTATQAGGKIRSFGDKVRTVLTFRLISEGIIQLKESLISGIAAIIDYDQALKDLQAITGATSTEVAHMGQKILEVASTTKFSAAEVAAGMRTLGQAGFTASEAVQTMQAVSDLATGTLSDMSQTVDLVTTAMRVFRIDASRSSEVADTFANAVNRSKLTVEKLRTAMNYVGPIAQDANISFQELSAAMMTLANSGMRASTIGTSLRQVFSQLVDPSKKFQEAASAAGVSMQDLDPQTQELATVLSNLGLVLKDTGTAFDIFGKRGASAALALTVQGSQYNDLLSTVSKTGTAAAMAAKQMEGLGVSFKNLKDKLGLLGVALGQSGVADAMRIFVDLARVAVDAITELVNTIGGKIIVTVGTLSTVLLVAVGSFIALKSAISAIGLGFFIKQVLAMTAALSSAGVAAVGFQAALGPIAIALAAISAIGVYLFYSLRDGAEEAAQEAALLAEKYGNLQKRLKDYAVEVVNLEKGSNALKNASLRLKSELLEVGRSGDKVAGAALAASQSIDPLTGDFIDGGVALKKYQEQIDKFRMNNLIESLNQTTTALNEQASATNSWLNSILLGLRVFMIRTEAASKSLGLIVSAADLSEYLKIWKEAEERVNNFKKGFASAVDVSEQLENNTLSWKKFTEAVETWRGNKIITDPQQELIDKYDTLKQSAISTLTTFMETNEVFRDAEGLQEYLKSLNIAELQIQAVVTEFKEMNKEAGKTFSNIVEKWQKEEKPNFLTSLVDVYEETLKKMGKGSLDEITKERLRAYEINRAIFIKEMEQLEQEQKVYEDTKASRPLYSDDGSRLRYIDTKKDEEFYTDLYRRRTEIIKKANKEQAEISLDLEAQNIMALEKALEERKFLENKANAEHINGGEKLYAELEKIQTDYEKKVKNIILGPDPTSDEQTREYKETLKDRESLLAMHLANLEQQEIKKEINEQEAKKRKAESELAFYQSSIKEAEKYRDKIDPRKDSEEYKKRNTVVLEAERKFYKERVNYLKTFADLSRQEERTKLETTEQLYELSLDAQLRKQKSALAETENTLKNSFAKNEVTIMEYYKKQRDIENESFDLQEQEIKDRAELRKKSIRALIEASNDANEKTQLGTELKIIEKNAEVELEEIQAKRIITLSNLNVEEDNAIDKTKIRTQAILNSIEKEKLASQAGLEGRLTIEQEFQNELLVIKNRHKQEEEKLLKLTKGQADQEVIIAKAKADQLAEIENRIAAHERDLFYVRLEQNAEFAGAMSNITKGLMDSGLVQNKKMFKIFKAFASAEAMINAYSAASKAFKNAPNPIIGAVMYAAALAKGLSAVAMINAQQMPAYAQGGLIDGNSPNKKADNIPIRATAGEYMQPVDTVKAYGIEVMEALRRRLISPKILKELVSGRLSSLPTFSQNKSLNFAEGGMIPSVKNQIAPPVSINMINQSGTGLNMKQEKPKFDGNKWVIGIILEELEKKGSFSKNLQAATAR
jgi:TP901 family phage tail tape measure protein